MVRKGAIVTPRLVVDTTGLSSTDVLEYVARNQVAWSDALTVLLQRFGGTFSAALREAAVRCGRYREDQVKQLVLDSGLTASNLRLHDQAIAQISAVFGLPEPVVRQVDGRRMEAITLRVDSSRMRSSAFPTWAERYPLVAFQSPEFTKQSRYPEIKTRTSR